MSEFQHHGSTQHRIILIAAMDRNRAIGKGNALPWHLPNDLKRFKQLTSGKTLLMGRKTALSLGRALPNRRNWVLTRQASAPYEGMEAVSSVDAALGRLDAQEDLMVIGGGEIYRLLLPMATRMHLTTVDTKVAEADTHFPVFDEKEWRVLERISHAADFKHPFAFEEVVWERRQPL